MRIKPKFQTEALRPVLSSVWGLPEVRDPKTKEVIAPFKKLYIDEIVAQTLIKKRNLVMKKNRDQFFVYTGREGCQPKGSKVLLANGEWKNIEDIKIGDMVLSPQTDGTNKFSKVIKLFKWKSKDIYDVCELNRQHKKLYSCSYNHEMPLNITGGTIKKFKAEDVYKLQTTIGFRCLFFKRKLTVGCLLRLKKSKGAIVYGFTLDSPSHWYVTNNYIVTKNSGKSTLAMQHARFLNPSTTLKRNVTLDPEKFPALVSKLGKGEVAILDEAFTGLASTRPGAKINHMLKSIFMEVRQRNLFVMIILPSIFYLDKYILLERANALFHTYFKNDARGRYAIYNQKQIKLLELHGRKLRDMRVVKPRRRGRFTPNFPFDKEGETKMFEEYNLMKRKSFEEKARAIEDESKGKKKNVIRDRMVRYLRFEKLSTWEEIKKITGLGEDTIKEICKKEEDEI